jgi:hypothetical protein
VRNLETRVSHEHPSVRPAQIFSLSPRARPEEAERPAGRALGVFDCSLRLLRAEGVTGDQNPTRRWWLGCRLLWEPWPEHKLQNCFLEFHLAAADQGREEVAAGRVNLGQRPLVQVRDPQAELPACFWETYQFFLPPGLPAGHYCLYASLWDAGAREWIPAAKTPDPSGYGVRVGEFSEEAERP